jgi:HEAT repeat protein
MLHRRVSALLLIVVGGVGCGVSQPASPSGAEGKPTEQAAAQQDEPLSEEADRLLAVLEDPKVPRSERVSAAWKMGQRPEKAAVPRLLALLPGDYDAVTCQIIAAFEENGDPRALPVLEQFGPNAVKKGVRLHGQINMALRGAIEACKKGRDRKE